MKTYEELRKINVNEHIEKKNNLSYLSWAWAVDILFQNDPEANWEYLIFEGKPWLQVGATSMVFCKVTAFGRSRTAQLPIMDYRNKAIADFTSFDLNTTMQRCLAKAISLHGIGLYIYAGEDVPPDAGDVIVEQIISADIKPMAGAWESMEPDMRVFLTDLAGEVMSLMNRGDFQGAVEHIEEQGLDGDQKTAFWTRFDSKQRAALKKAHNEIKEKTSAV